MIEQYLQIYYNYQQDDWVSWLSLTEFHLNNVQQTSMGALAFYANYRFHLAWMAEHRLMAEKLKLDIPAMNEWTKWIKMIQEELRSSLKSAQEK